MSRQVYQVRDHLTQVKDGADGDPAMHQPNKLAGSNDHSAEVENGSDEDSDTVISDVLLRVDERDLEIRRGTVGSRRR